MKEQYAFARTENQEYQLKKVKHNNSRQVNAVKHDKKNIINQSLQRDTLASVFERTPTIDSVVAGGGFVEHAVGLEPERNDISSPRRPRH